MYDQEARTPSHHAVEVQSAPRSLESIPPLEHAIPPEMELAFWERAVGGLTALAHRNCWASAITLAEMYKTYLAHNPRISSLDYATASEVALASEPLGQYVIRDPSLNRKPKPLPIESLDQQRWGSALIVAYQAIMRAVWANSRSHDVDGTASFRLSRQCIALIEVCERSVASTSNHTNVASWQPCSIVLPAYNEAENISETVERCVESLSEICPNFEVIVVNDGSSDQTGDIANAAATHDASVVAVHNTPNRGYGGALLAGFAVARGERIFFMDSDGQFDISEIATLLQIVESGVSPIAVGYRAKRSDPFMRKLNAWGWKQAAKRIVGLKGIRDIDCAFKLFPVYALRSCSLIAQGASVNVEMLLKFQRMGLHITQVPVKHMPRTKGSPTGAKLHVILRAFRELFHLRRHMGQWQPPKQPFQ